MILCSYVVDMDHLAYTSVTKGSMNCFVNLEIVALIQLENKTRTPN